MFRLLVVLYFTIFCLVHVSPLEYSRSEAGYAVGYSYYCPMNSTPPVISRTSLESLNIAVMGPGLQLTSYDYYHIEDLAQHPYMNFKNRTIMYVRGYWEVFFQPITKTICRLYQKMGYNVLVLNSGAVVKGIYPKATSYVRPLGKHVAEMLAKLTTLGLDPKKVDLIGVGMGAHTTSFIAKNYRQITGRNISSITALDPAGPCFRYLGPEGRLDPSDADFVMSMAVNIDGYGLATPVGHATFYVNGGEYQPADVWYMPCDMECSHTKAYSYWISALINPHTFVGLKCDTIQQARDADCYDRKPVIWNTMDLFVDRNKPGIYYVPTFSRYPYSIGKHGLKRRNDQVMRHLEELNKDGVMRWK